jgi:hypothetical protein
VAAIARPPIDLIVAAAFILIFGITVHAFQYDHALGEEDLYRVLVGLMDGAVSGKRLATDLHYDRDFGFGYLAAFYIFANPATLRDPDRLMALMNQIGFWSIMASLPLFWGAVRIVHGPVAATVALIVFALGPMIPEMATSGHQVMPMFAFLCAGAVLLFLPVIGWQAVCAAVAGGLLLMLGLMVRGELFLALPWLVLSRVDTRSLRRFIASAFLRSVAPGLALVAFALSQRLVQSTIGSTEMTSDVTTYFQEWYTWVTIIPGTVYMVVGCGFATVMAAAIAGTYVGWKTIVARKADLAELLAPAALIVVPLAFFLPNPAPARHFMLALAGMSILVGVAFAHGLVPTRRLAVGAAIGIGIANQVLSELARPTLVRSSEADSPYIPQATDYPTLTRANVGWEWRRHATLVEKVQGRNAFGDALRTICDKHVIVFSDEAEQLFSRLYANGTLMVNVRRVEINAEVAARPDQWSFHKALVGERTTRLIGLMGNRRDQTFVILAKNHLWPGDAVATIIANPAYADYKLVEDKSTLSKFDKTLIPADRAAHFGCSD